MAVSDESVCLPSGQMQITAQLNLRSCADGPMLPQQARPKLPFFPLVLACPSLNPLFCACAQVTAYTVRSWTGSSAVLSVGSVERGARFDGISNTGALGKNIYVALGSNAQIPSFGRVMFTPGAAEFALLACEFDSNGQRTSVNWRRNA